MTFVRALFWSIFVVGLGVYAFSEEAGIIMICLGAAALLGLAINQTLNNIQAIRKNSDELLKIAKKNAEQE